MLNSGVENQSDLSGIDRLKVLPDRPEFAFFKDKDLSHIQEIRKSQEYPFGTVIIETLASGSEGKLNEDSPMVIPLGEGRTFIAVLDGASSQKKIEGLDSNGVSGAFYISHLASMGFRESQEYKDLCLKPELSAKDVVAVMNRWIYGQMKDIRGVNYSDRAKIPGMAAAFVLIDENSKKISIAQVADSGIAAEKSDGTFEVLTPNLNERFDRETMDYVKELAKEYNTDLGHLRKDFPDAKEKIRIQLAESFNKKINQSGGCGVMNGMPEMLTNGLVYSYDIPMDGRISTLTLYSDGAVLPYMSEDDSPDDAAKGLVDSFYTNGEKSPLQVGADILAGDPNFTKNPRLKGRDDSTYIRITFNKV